MALEIKTADELADPELEARWAVRRAAREGEILQQILRTFVDQGGPVPVDEVAAAFPDRPPETVWDTLVALDEEDLIQIREGRVEIAYPFSAIPTPFVVRLAGSQERHACCAIDALGMAPMVGQRVHIRSQCHDCGAPLELSVGPDGPEGGGRRRLRMGGETGRRPAAAHDLALNDPQLLPVGRALEEMAGGEPRGTRSWNDGGRRIQAGPADFWGSSHRRTRVADRHVTVYWSTT